VACASSAKLGALYDSVVAVSTELDLAQVLLHIVHSGRQLAGADQAVLALWDESGTELRALIDDATEPGGATAQKHIPHGPGVFEVPIIVGAKPFGTLYLTPNTDGTPFSDDDRAAVMMLANAAGAAIQNARLYERSLRHRRRLEATTMITARLLGGAPSIDVLTEIARVAHQMAGADECGVRLADPTGRFLTLAAAAGELSTKSINEKMSIRGSYLGRVFTTGLSSSTSDLAVIAPGDTLVTSRGVGPVLAVALASPERTLGILSLSRYRGSAPFDPSDLSLVESFSGQAALALTFSEARDLHERAALIDDRERIARDLHDLVIQRIFAAGLSLEATAAMLEPGPNRERVAGVIGELDDTISELRTTIFALQQKSGATSSLRLQIAELVRRAAEQLGFTPRLRVSGEIGTRVDSEFAVHLLAVLREAISNVARHSGASRLQVTVDVGSELRLQVDDDGLGLPERLGHRGGVGNFEERASALGGSATLGPSDLGGTSLVWTVPLAPQHVPPSGTDEQ